MTEERRSQRPRREAIDAILRERLYQTELWKDDENHTVTDWSILLFSYVGKLAQEVIILKRDGINQDRVRKRIRQIAAICVAALERI